MNISSITQHITDPRNSKNQKYSLSSLLLIVFSSVVSGCGSIDDMLEFAHQKQEWLTQFVELNSIPCNETLRYFLACINPNELIRGFEVFAKEASGDIIAIDGKTMRGSRNSTFDAVHIISAWSHTHGLTLAALKSEGKKNEIKTIPKLLNLFDIKGATITLDAMGCQRDIAQHVIEGGGDYCLQLKDNQKSLNAEIQAYFHKIEREGFTHHNHEKHSETTKGHGRIEHREAHHFELSDWVKAREEWLGAQTAVRMTRTRIIGDNTSTEISWYLSSLTLDARKVANAIRGHWGVENNLHWQLDMTLNEDRYSSASGAENMAMIKRFCLNLLKIGDTTKRRIKQRILAAALDDDYRSKILLSG